MLDSRTRVWTEHLASGTLEKRVLHGWTGFTAPGRWQLCYVGEQFANVSVVNGVVTRGGGQIRAIAGMSYRE